MFNFHRFEFRTIRQEEADECAVIEQICFPPNEACTPRHMKERIHAAPESFLVSYDKVNHRIAGFLSGICTRNDAFSDDFFTDASLHDPDGQHVMLLSLAVRPEYRHQGLAGAIIDEYLEMMTIRGKEKIVLTCHEELVSFYRDFGFEDLGFGASVWGGVRWHDMELCL